MLTTDLPREVESQAWIDFQDCDPFGHLNNTKYLNYFMHARTQQLKEAYGFDIYQHTAETGRGWVVAQAHLAYLYPAKFNETVKIRTRLLHVDNFRLMPEAVMQSPDGSRIHAVGWIEFVYVDTQTGRPVKHDAALRNFLDSISLALPAGSTEFGQRVKELQKRNWRLATGA